jgi:hypothetical protein
MSRPKQAAINVSHLDSYFPDVRCATDMQRDRRCGEKPLTDGANMIGIHLLPKCDHAWRTIQKRADGCSRLSESDTRPTMKVSQRLMMLCRDRHRHHDLFSGGLDYLHL